MSLFNANRRQFLKGAGGFSLSLPILSSVLPKAARAGIYPYAQQPRFVFFATYHGGIWAENMWPTDDTLTDRQTILPGHDVRSGLLSARSTGYTRSLSPVLAADASLLTDRIVGQLNLLRGLDHSFYMGHHSGGFLGNFGRNDQEPSDYTEPGAYVVDIDYRPTIDQVMAWSNGVYPDLSGTLARSMNITSGYGEAPLSWSWSNPALRSGAVEAMPAAVSSLALFEQIFRADIEEADQTLVVDKVMESYENLTSGAFGPARRLSANDRDRLNAHMEHLFELERRLNTTVRCESTDAPSRSASESHEGFSSYTLDIDEVVDYYDLYTDVIAAAFRCDSSRIATIDVHQPFSSTHGRDDFHNDVAHLSHSAEGQDQMVDTHQLFFEQIFVNFLHKLDVEEANGMTYLDNSLISWAHEAGFNTHDNIGIPVITAGSAAGALTTGRYHDYRNRTIDNGPTEAEAAYIDDESLAMISRSEAHPGLLYNQWLATALQAMGSTPDEWEEPDTRGYGIRRVDDEALWPTAVQSLASEMLPGLSTE